MAKNKLLINKLYLIIFFFFIFFANSFSQFCFVSFIGEDCLTNEIVPLDKLSIKELTSNREKTVIETTLYLDTIFTDIGKNANKQDKITYSLNCPNLFETSTNFSLNNPINSEISISLYDIMGKKIATHCNNYPAGIILFKLETGYIPPGVYILVAENKLEKAVAKTVKIGNCSSEPAKIKFLETRNIGNARLKSNLSYRVIALSKNYEPDTIFIGINNCNKVFKFQLKKSELMIP